TIKCAVYQGDSANAGTVEVGKRADLVLRDADPTADITATNAIDTVFINGAILRKAARAEGIKRLEVAYDAMPVPRV
ncbi:MAG: amidohydrolase family protein, partial [Novosphingobium sp.]